jgi:hypothetical protein
MKRVQLFADEHKEEKEKEQAVKKPPAAITMPILPAGCFTPNNGEPGFGLPLLEWTASIAMSSPDPSL